MSPAPTDVAKPAFDGPKCAETPLSAIRHGRSRAATTSWLRRAARLRAADRSEASGVARFELDDWDDPAGFALVAGEPRIPFVRQWCEDVLKPAVPVSFRMRGAMS